MRPSPRTTLAALLPLTLAGTALGMYAPSAANPPLTWSSLAPEAPTSAVRDGSDAAVRLASSVFGHSGQLRAVLSDANRPLNLPLEWM
ncbi:MAG TPA: hypothetical protein VNP72_09800, partial [Longimicrobium sp.]|nr:hypothetical protein [Longimicrobium sp.]